MEIRGGTNARRKDIFISYKREDAEYASRLSKVLQSLGYSVFWDRDVQLGQRWNEVLDQALFEAVAVIVLWSRRSVRSEWVKHEASIALARGVLLQLVIEDGVEVPVQYRRENHASLIGWDGTAGDSGFPQLGSRLLELVAPPGEAALTPLQRWPSKVTPRELAIPWLAVLVGVVGLTLGAVGSLALAPGLPALPTVPDCRDELSRMDSLTRMSPRDDAYGNLSREVVRSCSPVMRDLEEGAP